MQFVDFLLNTIPLLIQLFAENDKNEDLVKTHQELQNDSNLPRINTYDFIVVGGGTAGCIVAGRLSEKYNVLLLEAGGSPPPAADPPFFATRVSADPTINYFFKSIPQAVGQSTGGVLSVHTGKMLGGSGSHNDLVHNRGSPRDFDYWAEVTGDESWKYQNVVQYFVKSERFVGERFGNTSEEFYGTDGPITVDTYVAPVLPLWFKAGKELGFPTEDPNGFQVQSFTPLNMNVDEAGKRSDSYSQYIKPFEKIRETLTVVRYANVSEILMDENNRAYGVAYSRHGFPQISYASKEVILSAGAISSPLLLMKSGIGPAHVLKEANIPVKVQLESVGKRFQEHPSIILSPFHVNDSSLFPRINPGDTEKLIEEYRQGSGILAALTEGPQCLKSSSRAPPDWPNIWIAMAPAVRMSEIEQVIRFYTVLGRPRSKGSISMNTTLYNLGIRDDTQLALIDFRMLEDEEDIEDMLEAIKFTFKIVEETNALQSIGMKYAAEHDPACLGFAFRSDEYWKCVLVQHTQPWIHMVGTCGMGSQESDSAVDSKLRVRGTSGLRVIDASVIPVVTNTNVNAPTMMVAEKGAQEILNTWKQKIEL